MLRQQSAKNERRESPHSTSSCAAQRMALFPEPTITCKAQQDKSVELTDCGQSDPLLPQQMQAQHSIAVAAEILLQCSLFRGIGHSPIQISVHVKPAIRHACANVCS